MEFEVLEQLASLPRQPYVTTEFLDALTPQQRHAIVDIQRQPFDEEAMKATYVFEEYAW